MAWRQRSLLISALALCAGNACATLPFGTRGTHVPSAYGRTPLRAGGGGDPGPLLRPAAPAHGRSEVAEPRTHVVAAGETLWRIARTNGTTVERLMAENGVADVRAVRIGTRLRLPPPADVAPLPPAARTASGLGAPAPAPTPAPTTAAPDRPSAGSLAPAPSASPSPGARRYPLRWPVEGTMTSRFGKRWGRGHDGIDISAPRGTPVYAAAAGEVLFADTHGGYGRLVVLRHADGLVTVYAHHDINLVRKGQRVSAGQLLGRVGQTGRATGPHLHFEVRRGASPQNPLGLLPP